MSATAAAREFEEADRRCDLIAGVVSQSVERRRLEYAAYVGVLRESGLAVDVLR
jgi:hypothetical protein